MRKAVSFTAIAAGMLIYLCIIFSAVGQDAGGGVAAVVIDRADLAETAILSAERSKLDAIESHWMVYISRKYGINKGDKIDWRTGEIIKAPPSKEE